MNTGEVAKRVGGLRGQIFNGSQEQWESTLYRGKHWIECFVVHNDACVARSEKFFINIK